MTSQLIKGKNIDTSKVTVSEPRVLDNGAKLVYVNYNNGRFQIQTPWMELPWDMSCYTEGPYPKYSIELSFKGVDDNEELQEFLEKMNQLDEKMVDIGLDKSVQFFKKKTTNREVVDGHYNRIIKVSKDKDTGEPDGKWPSTFRVKIPYRDGRFSSKLYTDGEHRDINDSESGAKIEDLLTKRTRARCILQCVGLWVASGNYMCQWQLQKAELEVAENNTTCEFMADTDDEEVDDENNDPVMLDESDQEKSNDAEEPVEPVPEKPKLKVKRRVKKSSN